MIQHKLLTAAPPRLQRMLLRLQPYDVEIKYKPGTEMVIADALSRSPSRNNSQINLDMQVNHVHFTEERLNSLKEETDADSALCELREIIIHGWPERMKELPKQLQLYWSFRDELSVEDGVILKGERIVIPVSAQKHILQKLHTGHQGIEKTILRAKDCVYWPNVNKDIEQLVRECPVCQKYQKNPPPEPLLQHEVPTRPWHTVGTDLFHLEGKTYLIIADYYSKFPFIRRMPQPCTSQAVVNATKELFAEHGIPAKVISDNGGHFSSTNYEEFATSWSFKHITSSPHYPRSNGFVERTIQTVKNTLKKAQESGYDTNMALLCIRSTPVDSIIPSPAELLYRRKIQGNIPVKIQNNIEMKDPIRCRLEERQLSQKNYHDRGAHEKPPLLSGQQVRVKDYVTGLWCPAKIKQKCGEPRSYLIETPHGGILRRNRSHLQDIPQEKSSDDHHVNGRNTPVPMNDAQKPEQTVIQHRMIKNQRTGPSLEMGSDEPSAMNRSQQRKLVATPKKTGQPYTTRSGRVISKPVKLDV